LFHLFDAPESVRAAGALVHGSLFERQPADDLTSSPYDPVNGPKGRA
jgi:hypothetical protein